ncbi:winged helix-turn-helix transcriptional regulator [Bradyrhizobium sp. 190]|uniref:MarR family winged helix-turn-helix transcriptional regulator n=1 Tax=Bradyrhizobium sp. 190 TaxID=2782658 RepID=UPI001FFA48AB|nr:MarR family winged helix-turn-helix transcriptional regulator [Bradyrhizobium sp. 190]MCK1513224.1 winged helix-turn-helix transcriptional regulator [Bradyrhizobium sp. 190]
MATRKRPRLSSSKDSPVSSKAKQPDMDQKDKLLSEFTWNLVAINVYLEDIRRIWASALGVSGPQWLILMAISDLDTGAGISVGQVSTKIHASSTFVAMQSKSLENSGFLARAVSPNDARVVLMSLTEKSRTEIAKLSLLRTNLRDNIFADMTDRTLKEMTETMTLMRRRIEKAALQLDLDNARI